MIDYDAYDVDEDVRHDRRAHRRAAFVPNRAPKRRPAEVRASLAEEDETGLTLSYNATRHERAWISQALGLYFAQGLLTDVLRLAKGGKEAKVYLCTASDNLAEGLVAAKIYRPRRFRNRTNSPFRAITPHLIPRTTALDAPAPASTAIPPPLHTDAPTVTTDPATARPHPALRSSASQ